MGLYTILSSDRRRIKRRVGKARRRETEASNQLEFQMAAGRLANDAENPFAFCHLKLFSSLRLLVLCGTLIERKLVNYSGRAGREGESGTGLGDFAPHIGERNGAIQRRREAGTCYFTYVPSLGQQAFSPRRRYHSVHR